ncbi:MAG: hypothetical protein II996_06260 [Oscillospiraceae bacterium]|nr:hypothetical protein [Oscillospiraceae bacterium]
MLKFGVSKRDITPKMNMAIPGHFDKRFVNEILDPLYVKVMVFENDGHTACTVVCDAVSIARDDVLRIRRGIFEKCGIDEKNISVSATHTHTGGPIWDWYDAGEHNPIYINMLVDAAVAAASDAFENRVFAKIGFAKCEVEGISFIRRFKMKDGRYLTGVAGHPENAIEPVGTPDNSFVVGKVCDENGKLIAFISNFGVHLDMMGRLPNKGKISADYPGELARLIKEKFGDEVESVFFTGPCGNTNHVNVLKLPVNCTVDKDFPEINFHEKTALALFHALCELEENIELSDEAEVVAMREFLSAKLRRPTKEYVDTAERFLHGEDVIFEGHGIEEYNLQLRRQIAIATLDAYHNPINMIDVEVMAFKIGDAAFVMWPGEVFVEYGKAVREAFCDKNVIIAELSNGSFGSYLPTEEGLAQGGYEPTITGKTTPEPKIGTDMVNSTIELLGKAF